VALEAGLRRDRAPRPGRAARAGASRGGAWQVGGESILSLGSIEDGEGEDSASFSRAESHGFGVRVSLPHPRVALTCSE